MRLRGLPEPDGEARLQGGLGLLVLRMAIRTWRAQDAGSLPEAVEQVWTGVRGLV